MEDTKECNQKKTKTTITFSKHHRKNCHKYQACKFKASPIPWYQNWDAKPLPVTVRSTGELGTLLQKYNDPGGDCCWKGGSIPRWNHTKQGYCSLNVLWPPPNLTSPIMVWMISPPKYDPVNLMIIFLPLKSEGKFMAESNQTITKKKTIHQCKNNKQASFLDWNFYISNSNRT